jgi:hypothetical protein
LLQSPSLQNTLDCTTSPLKNVAKNEFFKTGLWRECNIGLPDGRIKRLNLK